HVARERRPATDDLVASVEGRLRKQVDDPVGARADDHLLERHTVPRRKRRPQRPRTTVRIAVQIACGALDRLERGGKGRKWSFIRRELDHAVESKLALELLDRLPRLVR